MRWFGLLVVLVACKGDGGGKDGNSATATGQPCDICSESEACLVFTDLDGNSSEECAPLPGACDPLDCFDNTCKGALYDLCGDDHLGSGCSDSFPPVIVSCNE